MVGKQGIEIVRIAVTAVITALSATGTHNPYVLALIAGASAFGAHAVPSLTQKGITMTSPIGAELMGIVKPVETAIEPAVPAVETAVVAAEEAIKTPDTETIETAVADAVPAVEGAVKAAPGAAQALRNAAHDLLKLAESFE
jgi:hypothetical protein